MSTTPQNTPSTPGGRTMERTGHTEGPWHWTMETITKGVSGRGAQRHAVLSNDKRQAVLHPNWVESEGGVWQAWITVRPEDASMICASPAMFEALKKALEALQGFVGYYPHGVNPYLDEACGKARDALPKLQSAIAEAGGGKA